MKLKSIVSAAVLSLALLPGLGLASGGGAPLPNVDWGHKGPFGSFDRAAIKRGAQVAVEVCLGCHSIKYIKFDQLKEVGFNEVEMLKLAEAAGKGKSDRMLSAMSDPDAKDSFGVIPPDLSLMTKARKGYENYTYGILTGYANEKETAIVEAAAEDETFTDEELKKIAGTFHLDKSHLDKVKEVALRIGNGENFNKYFPGNFFAMPQPLSNEQVEYADNTPATVAQMSKDVTVFLSWAAEPRMEERKSTGSRVLLYLILLTAMLYALKRRIWARIH